jgi:DNA repair protein RecO (recombination protein O)
LLDDPLAAAGMDWVTSLCATSLPEEQPYPSVYEALDAVLFAMEAAPSARRWAGAIILFEGLLMQALGYGGEHPARTEDWPVVLSQLNANGARLSRHLLSDRQQDVLAVRVRLVERFKRAVA